MIAHRLPIFLIDTECPAARTEAVLQHLRSMGGEVQRIQGVGSQIPRERWTDADHGEFFRRHGREIRPTEYGRYQSHLIVIEKIANSGAEAGIVLEDTALPDDRFLERAIAARHAAPQAGIIKFAPRRRGGFRPYTVTESGDRIGRRLFGSQGSAASYLITRSGADRVMRVLSTMSSPWEIALERGWETHVPVFSTQIDLVSQADFPTEITPSFESKPKVRGKLASKLFSLSEFGLRLAYAMEPFHLAPLEELIRHKGGHGDHTVLSEG